MTQTLPADGKCVNRISMLPTTGLAAAEPQPEEADYGIPDEQELMDRDGGDR